MKPPSEELCVVGIIVSYRPDIEMLRHLVEIALPQVARLVVVDNGREAGQALSVSDRVEIVSLGENLGLARAQNVGIERARLCGATHVLLLDQDSVPADDMVSTLVSVLQRQQALGVSVACVGPNYQDERHGNAKPFVRLKGLRFARLPCEEGKVVEVDFLIASGCLVPLAVFDDVGPMAEELFIDYIDIEWCLRARARGFRSFGACSARMRHALGEDALRVGARMVPVHAPLRQYYNVRNAIWLCRRSFVSLHWRMALMARLVQYFLFYALAAPPRLVRLGMMLRGLRDGAINRMGKFGGKA